MKEINELTEPREAEQTEMEEPDSEVEQVAEEGLPTELSDEEPLPSFSDELSELSREMPELATHDEARYSELRALGLTPREAYLATSRPRTRSDNRSHLKDVTPSRAHVPYSGMTRQTLEGARALFEGMSDAEIQRLYKKVTR